MPTKKASCRFSECYGEADASLWWQRWRIFFMACAELLPRTKASSGMSATTCCERGALTCFSYQFSAFQIGWLSPSLAGRQQMPWLGPLQCSIALLIHLKAARRPIEEFLLVIVARLSAQL